MSIFYFWDYLDLHWGRLSDALSEATDIKYISQKKEKQQYIAVGMFIETSDNDNYWVN